MDRFKFGPARAGEEAVFGAERPGYPWESVGLVDVRDWILFMQANGIRRVCSVLPDEQLAYFRCDLLGLYREAFGPPHVCSAAVTDMHLCDPATLEGTILPFLADSDRTVAPVVVHCSGGMGRTGHVLAAWLVRHRGLSVTEALSAVRATGRNPAEAVELGNATDAQLRQLVGGT